MKKISAILMELELLSGTGTAPMSDKRQPGKKPTGETPAHPLDRGPGLCSKECTQTHPACAPWFPPSEQKNEARPGELPDRACSSPGLPGPVSAS